MILFTTGGRELNPETDDKLFLFCFFSFFFWVRGGGRRGNAEVVGGVSVVRTEVAAEVGFYVLFCLLSFLCAPAFPICFGDLFLHQS